MKDVAHMGSKWRHMKKYYGYGALIIFILLFGYFCYYLYRGQYNENNWQEEVLLSNGDIIIVDRKATFYGQWEDNLIVTLNIPKRLEKIPTPAKFITSEKVLLFDYFSDENRWYIITTFAKFPQVATCPIYKLYTYDGREWYEIEFDPKFYDKQTNLIGHIVGDDRLITVKDISDRQARSVKKFQSFQKNESLETNSNLFFSYYLHYVTISKKCYYPIHIE